VKTDYKGNNAQQKKSAPLTFLINSHQYKLLEETACILHYQIETIPLPNACRNDSCSRRSCSCSCLPTATNSPVPPSQTLGVLFFPLSPPSRKGATHNQKILAPQLASKAELPLTYELRLPTPTRKSVSHPSALAIQSQQKKTQKKKAPSLSFFLSFNPSKP